MTKDLSIELGLGSIKTELMLLGFRDFEKIEAKIKSTLEGTYIDGRIAATNDILKHKQSWEKSA